MASANSLILLNLSSRYKVAPDSLEHDNHNMNYAEGMGLLTQVGIPNPASLTVRSKKPSGIDEFQQQTRPRV
jgi:hypothetical protein